MNYRFITAVQNTNDDNNRMRHFRCFDPLIGFACSKPNKICDRTPFLALSLRDPGFQNVFAGKTWFITKKNLPKTIHS